MSTHLFNLPHDKALDRRWRHGRKQFGPKWAGRHPLYEALEEAHDLAIYLRLANGESNTLTAAADRICSELRKLCKAAHEGGVNLQEWDKADEFKW